LCHALADCRVRNDQIPQTAIRLTEPPESLQLPTLKQTECANALVRVAVPFDGDMVARMLRREENQPDAGATWKALTPRERKRAKRLWAWALDAGLDSAPQGRPSVIDSALVLYCSRVIAEACGQPRLKLSRPPDGGAPYGPMWRALMAALPLAELFLARADGNFSSKPRDRGDQQETIVDIVKTARTKEFRDYCRMQHLGPSSDDVVQHPATFRRALMLARASRRENRT
jgi:hypothetical protein